MEKQSYLSWMAQNTVTQWLNDSAVMPQLEYGLQNGAVGATTNPPLSYEGITSDDEYYAEKVASLRRDCSDEEFALEAMGLVVKRVSQRLMPLHKERGGLYGCVRAQVQPSLQNDADGMLEMGKKMSRWGENVMIKIPGTEAGIWVLEELAALGIPTNPTVLTTVSQIVASAEAYERGVARAIQAGITPAWSTEALVMGRLQDYLTDLNAERNAGADLYDLECASLALVKRTYQIFKEKGYKTVMQGAAFRCARHVEQLVGGAFCSTIHPKIQKLVEEADAAGTIRREICIDEPVDASALERIAKAFPEFTTAYEPGAIKPCDFAAYGAVKMTLDNFDTNGWQKLAALQ